ncbi:helix-turn-helix domain-containing protein [Peterkaempfera bronchialis]|uniref:helix-turn-helix domain-containing protein n=1 Tax=Peterkaempfera bronchialis TaxID=2126346 RepID=UPI003C2FFDF5
MRLGSELRELRNRVGLSMEGASDALARRDQDISPSKLSRLENGRGAIKLQDIRALLDLYEVQSEGQHELLLQMAREARAAAHGAWWTDYESALPSGLSTYVALEAGASRLLAFTQCLIEGLFQTEDVARALIRAADQTASPETIARQVEVRMRRQRAIWEEPRLELVTIMDEAALLRPVAGEGAMRQQIRRVVEVCEALPNVKLQVIPLDKGAYAAQHGMFTLIEPRDLTLKPVVYVDSTGGNLYMQRIDQITRFRRMFGDLQAIALDTTESLDLVRSRC